MTSASDLRREYSLKGLHERDLDPSPVKQFAQWFQEALAAQLPLPDAMALATATRGGKPSVRMVLLKGFDERGFVFYTNYESRKGKELAENPHAAAVLYWAELGRQVCITGEVSKVSREESQCYFRTRPEGSRLGAWASRQSEVIPDREVLEDRLRQLAAQYQGQDIPLPPDWGGYRLSPDIIELWQSRPNRLHDRLRYTRQPNGDWLLERLSP